MPQGCLDVLAQQVIACVAMEPWDVPALFDLVRGAYPFHNLSAEAFESVLRLVSGRFPTPDFRDLRARVVWDRIHNRLAALPGTAQLALVGGGTIPDTGQFPVYLGEGGPRLGELDEEFVFERRVGETFVLGNSTWRIDGHRAASRGGRQGRGPDGGDAVLARGERGALARAGRGGRGALPRAGRAARRPGTAPVARARMPARRRRPRAMLATISSRASSGWRAPFPTIARS